MRMLRWMYRATKLDRIINERMRDNESGEHLKESPRKEVEVVWACDAKRRAIRRMDGD